MEQQSVGGADVKSGPRFGDRVRNTSASPANPHRFGIYVETIYRTGFTNRGKWYRITDGAGEFWTVDPTAIVVLAAPAPPSDRVAPEWPDAPKIDES